LFTKVLECSSTFFYGHCIKILKGTYKSKEKIYCLKPIFAKIYFYTNNGITTTPTNGHPSAPGYRKNGARRVIYSPSWFFSISHFLSLSFSFITFFS
jgi:hypothetical protein